MKYYYFQIKSVVAAIMLSVIITSASGQAKDPKELLMNLDKACGTWDKLYALKDVEFTYKYHYPEPNIMDLSTERYIFEGEHSWAKYSVHQINAMKDKEGEVVQSYNGKTDVAKTTLKGEIVALPAEIGTAQFLRKANYFWFVMMFKLTDPGTILAYEGQETVNGINYDKVTVAYESATTGKEQNDAYILFINPETGLVDRFFFSLPLMGINVPAILMEVAYTEVQGVKLPLTRNIYMPGPDGKVGEVAALVQTLTGLKFNNGFNVTDFDL